MSITGHQLIAGVWQAGEGGSYQSIDPASGEALAPELTYASAEQVQAVVAGAAAAAPVFAATSLQARSQFLERCAEEIMALGDELLERVMAETGYPRARAEGERGRTCGQLRMFAQYILSGDYLDARIDPALPERKPLPRPDVRFFKQALGPVAVFGSSNFPLAFSAAGGDTASALAAGCPVVVKSHNSHPGTGELVAQAMARAVTHCGMPEGTFSFVSGPGNEVGAALVTAPEIKAVGFTGSYRGGMALHALASARPEPIPCFAEMGSVNPVVLMPQALAQSAEKIAEGFVASVSLGTGQFCVNPGLVLGISGSGLDAFMAAAGKALSELPAGVMLNEGVAMAFGRGAAELAQQPGERVVAQGEAAEGKPGFCGRASLFAVQAADFVNNKVLQEEVFGPCSLVVECRDQAELLQVVDLLKGQLSGTLHGSAAELEEAQALVQLLQRKVGRVVINQFPTGVEVTHAMMHGGPFPASNDPRFTSVGTAAIDRFVRPVCFQNTPKALLPPALRDYNPWQINRLVDGKWTRAAL